MNPEIKTMEERFVRDFTSIQGRDTVRIKSNIRARLKEIIDAARSEERAAVDKIIERLEITPQRRDDKEAVEQAALMNEMLIPEVKKVLRESLERISKGDNK